MRRAFDQEFFAWGAQADHTQSEFGSLSWREGTMGLSPEHLREEAEDLKRIVLRLSNRAAITFGLQCGVASFFLSSLIGLFTGAPFWGDVASFFVAALIGWHIRRQWFLAPRQARPRSEYAQ